MKKLLIGLFLFGSMSSFAYECEYSYRLDKVTIHKNYDSVYGNYDWKNEIEVVADNLHGERITNSNDIGWIYSVFGPGSESAINYDTETFLPLQINGKEIVFQLTVVEQDRFLNPDDEIIDEKIVLDTRDLSWLYNERIIRKNGIDLSYEIKKNCR